MGRKVELKEKAQGERDGEDYKDWSKGAVSKEGENKKAAGMCEGRKQGMCKKAIVKAGMICLAVSFFIFLTTYFSFFLFFLVFFFLSDHIFFFFFF